MGIAGQRSQLDVEYIELQRRQHRAHNGPARLPLPTCLAGTALQGIHPIQSGDYTETQPLQVHPRT